MPTTIRTAPIVVTSAVEGDPVLGRFRPEAAGSAPEPANDAVVDARLVLELVLELGLVVVVGDVGVVVVVVVGSGGATQRPAGELVRPMLALQVLAVPAVPLLVLSSRQST